MARKKKTFITLLACTGGCFIIMVLYNITDIRDADTEMVKYSSHVKTSDRKPISNTPLQKTSKMAFPPKVSFIPRISSNYDEKNKIFHPFSSRISHGSDNNISLNKNSILVLSSVGRSGSSFLGELLAAQENNFYIFEPLRALKRGTLRKELVQEELIKSFQCQISPRFLSLENNAYISIKHPYTMGKSRHSLTLIGLKNACESEPLRIIKTIRTRLEWTKRLLEEKDLNLKVLHLVRDPRGSFKSMTSLKWKISVKDMCYRLTNDLKLKSKMEKLYPGRYLFIKYEDLCRTPYIKTREIFKFQGGINITSAEEDYSDDSDDPVPAASLEPPKSVINYLKSHMFNSHLSNDSPWSTGKNPFSHYQKWRNHITQKELAQIEEECQEALKLLGYRVFGSLENVRNLSIPLNIGERTFKIMYSDQNDTDVLYT